MPVPARFPADFAWGSAMSAYQVEGARSEDGKTDSIWDRFAHTPGTIVDGSDGDVACDQYHRVDEDIALTRDLGLNAFRFSIAWPRIVPAADGVVNPKGVDHYDRLVDALLEAGVTPYPCLYHWDLPAWLQDAGGWADRSIVGRFAAYADVMVRALGDRIAAWTVLNEPHIFTVLGHETGEHAPGFRDWALGLKVSNIVNLAHAEGVRVVRASAPRALVGSAWNMDVAYPASDDPADVAAAERHHARWNQWYLDPLVKGAYPVAYLDMDRALELADVRPGDLEAMRTRFDWIGLNHYSRAILAFDPSDPVSGYRRVPGPGEANDFGWEIWPPSIHRQLLRIDRDYGHLPVYITENGCADNTRPGADGAIHDAKRLRYLQTHLAQVARAIDDGVDVRGYFAWSLLDNFEWAAGYTQRFGMTWVDFDDPARPRTVKDSGRWLARFIAGQEPLAYDPAAE